MASNRLCFPKVPNSLVLAVVLMMGALTSGAAAEEYFQIACAQNGQHVVMRDSEGTIRVKSFGRVTERVHGISDFKAQTLPNWFGMAAMAITDDGSQILCPNTSGGTTLALTSNILPSSYKPIELREHSLLDAKLAETKPLRKKLNAAAFVPGQQLVIGGDVEGRVYLWNTKDGSCLGAGSGGQPGPDSQLVKGILEVRVREDGKRAVTCSGNGDVCVWKIEEGKLTQVRQFQRQTDGLGMHLPSAFPVPNPLTDEERVVMTGPGNTVQVWSASTNRKIASWEIKAEKSLSSVCVVSKRGYITRSGNKLTYWNFDSVQLATGGTTPPSPKKSESVPDSAYVVCPGQASVFRAETTPREIKMFIPSFDFPTKPRDLYE